MNITINCGIVTLDNCILKYCISGILLILLALISYWSFFIPIVWKKVLDIETTSLKKNAVNRLRHQRKIGINNLPPPYPNGWYAIMESPNLKKEHVHRISILGEHLVVFRTKQNKVYALDTYCPHLGADMGMGGRVINDEIQCPFHQWSFNGETGLCAKVPYSKCPPATAKVRAWKTIEVNDYIFIWYHTNLNEEPWEIPVIKEIDNKKYVYHGRNEFYFNCHIQEIPENGADLAHFEAIHNDNLLANISTSLPNSVKQIGKHKWEATWMPTDVQHIATVQLKHRIEFTKSFHLFNMNVTAHQIGPSYVQFHMLSPSFGHIKVLQTIVPIKPLLQKVVHRFYAPRYIGPVMKIIVIGESLMFQRDVNIWSHKAFIKHPKLVKEDTPIKLFRKWYSQFYTNESIQFTNARELLEW